MSTRSSTDGAAVEVDLRPRDALGEQLLACPLVGLGVRTDRARPSSRPSPTTPCRRACNWPGASIVPANHEPIMTDAAPAARAGQRHAGSRTPPSAHTCAPAAAACAVSSTAEHGYGGHHARRAHRSRTHADLQDRRSRREVARALRGHDVPGDERDAETQTRDGVQRPQHPLLVPVRGVERDVHARGRRAPSPSHGVRPLMPTAAATMSRPSGSTAGLQGGARRRALRGVAEVPVVRRAHGLGLRRDGGSNAWRASSSSASIRARPAREVAEARIRQRSASRLAGRRRGCRRRGCGRRAPPRRRCRGPSPGSNAAASADVASAVSTCGCPTARVLP